MNEKTPRIAVIGGGITGLSVAYYLLKELPSAEVVVFERGGEVGGNIVTERRDGFLLDGGPDSFLRTKPDAVALAKELGLEAELMSTRPETHGVYLVHRGELERMPAGMSLAIPTRLGPMVRTPLLSWRGKFRMLGDVLLPASERADEDESIASFVERRFGVEAAAKLAAPLLGGIFAGDVRQLSIQSTFPQLSALEAQHRSLVVGLFKAQAARRGTVSGNRFQRATQFARWLARQEAQAQSPFMSLRSGMASLVQALSGRIGANRIQSGRSARNVRAQARGTSLREYVVEFDDGSTYNADSVVLACPAHAGAQLFANTKLAELLGEIPYVSTATVFFGFERTHVQHPLDGVGFVVPEGEGKILAATWVSSKWEDRAPEGHVLMRAFLGGARDPSLVARASDDELVHVARRELERLMGPLGPQQFSRVFRYPDANPQPVVGHRARLERIAEELEALPGVHLAGAAYEGVGIPDCIRQARDTAGRCRREILSLV